MPLTLSQITLALPAELQNLPVLHGSGNDVFLPGVLHLNGVAIVTTGWLDDSIHPDKAVIVLDGEQQMIRDDGPWFTSAATQQLEMLAAWTESPPRSGTRSPLSTLSTGSKIFKIR